jgi:hypothetical protein
LKNLLETAAATPPDWELEYNFRTAFQLPRLDASQYSLLYSKIAASADIARHWTSFYASSHSEGNSITPANWRGYYCSLSSSSVALYNSCISAAK